ncbi:MAG: hypothetical protein GY754_04370 [bacterium]|nr:hypothetical protein [bacterium]
MKKMKKIFAVLFVLSLVLVACEQGEDESGINTESGVDSGNEPVISEEISNTALEIQAPAPGGEDHELWVQHIVHEAAFKNLYKKAAGKILKTSQRYICTIRDSASGSARVEKSVFRNVVNGFPYYDNKYVITFNNFSMNGYSISGSYSFFTGKRYAYISNPPTANFIYAGGGAGGTLSVSGKITGTVPVEIFLLNMTNDYLYHYNETLVINYTINGYEFSDKITMLAALYRKTFRDAYTAFLRNPAGNNSSVSIFGPEGGSASMSVVLQNLGSVTRSVASYRFSNYAANGLVLNGSIDVTHSVDNSSGAIIEGCHDDFYISVSGCFEASVRHLAKVHKPASIWNFRMGYFVDTFYFESVGVLIPVSMGG